MVSDLFETQIHPRGTSDRLGFAEVFDDSPWPITLDRLTFGEGFSSVQENVATSDLLQTATTSLDLSTLTEITTYTGLQDTFSVSRLATSTVVEHLTVNETFSSAFIKAGAKPVACSDSLSLSDSFSKNILGDFEDFLSLLESQSAEIAQQVSDLAEFSEQFTPNWERNQSFSDGLVFAEGFLGDDINNDSLYRYASAGNLSSLVLPSAITTVFQLFYPATGTVTDSVTLQRMPNLGNRDRLSFNRVLRETRWHTNCLCRSDLAQDPDPCAKLLFPAVC